MQNQYGLCRSIPDPIKREVRQRDGFGCVVCGNAIIDYEHFDPEFCDARQHDPNGIVLLCISCHAKKNRHFLSKDTIAKARETPKARQLGFSFGPFDVGIAPPEIIIGNLKFRNVETLIQISGTKILSVSPPTEPNLPFTIDAFLTDRNGATILEIVKNEWQSSIDNWDVQVSGGRITIRRALGDIILKIRTDPPDRLIFEQLDLQHRGTTIKYRDGQSIEIIAPDGSTIRSSGAEFEGCRVGVQVDDNRVMLGVGGGSVSLRSMSMSRNPTGRNAFGSIRRNASCQCGSEKRYKRCCGRHA